MASKKEVTETEEVKVEKAEEKVCGHINRQFYNSDGVLEDLPCILKNGHAGDHSAMYSRKIGTPINDEKGRVVKTDYHLEDAVAFWGDMAGTPSEKVVEGETGQMSLLQKDLVMQILNKNPNLPLKSAIAQAKASDEWKAASEF